MPHEIGFLGTGTITAAIATGLNSVESESRSLIVSPRNAAVAAELARRLPNLCVAESNQQVIDESEVVMLAVRPQVAAEVLSQLRFRADQRVISLISGYSLAKLSELLSPARQITRAVPLPSTAQRRSPTAIYPRDPVTREIFAFLGAASEVDTEIEFDAFCTATATMAAYFGFVDCVASWLHRNGIPAEQARDYMARIYAGLSDTTLRFPERSFQALAAEHSTPGGINAQVLAELTRNGVFDTFGHALDAVMRRVTGAAAK